MTQQIITRCWEFCWGSCRLAFLEGRALLQRKLSGYKSPRGRYSDCQFVPAGNRSHLLRYLPFLEVENWENAAIWAESNWSERLERDTPSPFVSFRSQISAAGSHLDSIEEYAKATLHQTVSSDSVQTQPTAFQVFLRDTPNLQKYQR